MEKVKNFIKKYVARKEVLITIGIGISLTLFFKNK
jgi:hypothetical protein